jgi:hypothetical protein
VTTPLLNVTGSANDDAISGHGGADGAAAAASGVARASAAASGALAAAGARTVFAGSAFDASGGAGEGASWAQARSVPRISARAHTTKARDV